MKSKISLKSKKRLIIVVVALIIIAISIPIIVTLIRSNTINKQVIANLNEQEKVTTVFCNGKNISFKSDIYNKLKDEGYDLIIYNTGKYIARISNDNLVDKINMDIDIETYENFKDSQAYILNTNGVNLKELEVVNNIQGVDYLSEFYVEDEIKFIKNDARVNENGFVKIELLENMYTYILAYIIPTDINIEDVEINKGATKKIELGISEEEYTVGSIKYTCSDEEAIEIDSEYNIKANKVGEYTLSVSTDKFTKDIGIKILQPVEKIDLDKTTLDMIVDGTSKINATITPEDAVNKELSWTSSDESIVTVDSEGNVKAHKAGNCEITIATVTEPIVQAKVIVEVSERANLSNLLSAPVNQNVAGITYINGIMLVNKTHSIPSNYSPGLNSQAYQAYLQLKSAAAAAGYDMPLLSGYRSYETQERLYNNYVATYGQAEADTFSARPGTSEHQTGLAMDVGMIEDWYGDTDAGKWLAQNCYKYGFIIRYPKGKESITGYKYEPWHIRYLGVDIATDVYNSGLCLEEYLGV